jgi:hypothetical protein
MANAALEESPINTVLSFKMFSPKNNDDNSSGLEHLEIQISIEFLYMYN